MSKCHTQALKKHYERVVTMEDGQEYNLKIIPSRVTDDDSTDAGNVYPIVLSFECGTNSNFVLLPNVLFYCKDDGDKSFMDTAAHEIGTDFEFQHFSKNNF